MAIRKKKLISRPAWSLAFPRALGILVGFNLRSNWLLNVFSFLLFGRSDNFGFSFMTLNQRALYLFLKH